MKRLIDFYREFRRVKALLSFLSYVKLRIAVKLQRKGLVDIRLRFLPGKLYLRSTNLVDYHVLKYVFNDRYHLPFASLPASPVILDLGANIGFTCVDYAHLFPNARIFGYEMDKENFDLAVLNTKPYSSVTMVNAAVGPTSGEGYYTADASVAADAYQLTTGPSASAKRINMSSMADIVRRHKLSRVDFIKMDIEGAELDVFAAGDLSWLDIVDRLHVEIHADEHVPIISEKLRAQGFNVDRDANHWRAVVAYR